MTHLKHGVVAAAITLAGALSFSGVALASSADFIDNGHYTTDTNNGLDWLDVTISVNQSYNHVSSQFGSGGEYEGWRYATGVEFNRMVSNWTGTVISDYNFDRVTHAEGSIDGLHVLLGITFYVSETGDIYDPLHRREEGSYQGATLGMLADIYYGQYELQQVALIYDDDKYTSSPDETSTRHFGSRHDDSHVFIGSFLVRDSLTPIPVPAAVWLMGSGLLGLLGYSRHRKPTTAA